MLRNSLLEVLLTPRASGIPQLEFQPLESRIFLFVCWFVLIFLEAQSHQEGLFVESRKRGRVNVSKKYAL